MTGPRLPYIRSMGRSALVVLVPQFPVAGEVEGWGVFLIFGDVLRTFRIWLLGRMGSLSLRVGLSLTHIMGRWCSFVEFLIVLSAV